MNFQQKLLGFSNLTIVFVQLICTLLWFLPFFFNKEPNTTVSITFLGNSIIEYSSLTASLIQYVFVSSVGFIINFILEKLKLIPLHNRFFYICFLFVFSITSYAQFFNTTTVSFFLLLIALYNLLLMFQSEAVFRAFNSILLLCIATLFNIEYIWFIPLFWIAFIQLKAFTKNTFFATIFGIITFGVAVFLTAYITNTLTIVENYFTIKSISFFDFNALNFSTFDIVSFIVFLLFLFYYISTCFVNRYKESNILYAYYSFFILLVFFVFILYIINSFFYKEICLPIISLMTFFATFYYNFKQNKYSNILLSIFFALGVLYRIIFLLT